MNAMDQWVLRVFYGIGAAAGLVACALAVLIGLVFCFQIPWWLWKQTETWIRIAKIFRKAARLRKRWKVNTKGFVDRLTPEKRRLLTLGMEELRRRFSMSNTPMKDGE